MVPSTTGSMLIVISGQMSGLGIPFTPQPTSTSRHTDQAFALFIPLVLAIVTYLRRCLSLNGASHAFVHVCRSGATERVGSRGVGLFRIVVVERSDIVGLAGYFCLCVWPEGAIRGCGAWRECFGFEFFNLVLWRGFDTGFVL